jgi:hypothetical protein
VFCPCLPWYSRSTSSFIQITLSFCFWQKSWTHIFCRTIYNPVDPYFFLGGGLNLVVSVGSGMRDSWIHASPLRPRRPTRYFPWWITKSGQDKSYPMDESYPYTLSYSDFTLLGNLLTFAFDMDNFCLHVKHYKNYNNQLFLALYLENKQYNQRKKVIVLRKNTEKIIKSTNIVRLAYKRMVVNKEPNFSHCSFNLLYLAKRFNCQWHLFKFQY